MKLMPIKVIATDWDVLFGAPNGGTTEELAIAIRYAADRGANIINMSLGYSSPTPSRVVEDALRYAVNRGAFVAIAAGNEYLDGNPVSQPAALAPVIPGVMAVGAIDSQLRRAPYSNVGSYVEIAAPGGNTEASDRAEFFSRHTRRDSTSSSRQGSTCSSTVILKARRWPPRTLRALQRC